jgi:hypothetical protein
MIFIVGGYYQTTHINPTLMTSMGKLKEPPHPHGDWSSSLGAL